MTNTATIVFKHYDRIYTVEGIPNDSSAADFKETFDRLLVQAGFPTDIQCSGGGHYELSYTES